MRQLLSLMCSRTRIEKNLSRDTSNNIPERCSKRERISESRVRLQPPLWLVQITIQLLSGSLLKVSVNLKPALIFVPLCLRGENVLASCRGRNLTHSWRILRIARSDTKLRQRLVQTALTASPCAQPCVQSACALRCLPSDVGDDLHRIRHTFSSTYLLFRSQRDFLYQFGPIAGQHSRSLPVPFLLGLRSRSHFHFLGAFFHDDDSFIRLSLNCFDQRRNVLRRSPRVFGQFSDFIGDYRESASCLSGARRFDSSVEREEIGLFQ